MQRFLPKSQISKDILLLVVLIVPLIVAGVVWGIKGDFFEEVVPLTPTPIIESATPMAWMAID